MPSATKSSLLKRGIRRKAINLPNSDLAIHIRELSATETRDYAERAKALNADPDSNIDLLAHGIVLGVIDEQGNQMFTADDLPAIKESMSIGTLKFISTEIGLLSGGDSDDQKKESVSSPPIQNSDSPLNSAGT